MTINKAYKIRIYPSRSQIKQINLTVGCCRFTFNQMLAERKEVYEKLKADKDGLKSYKYKTEKELKAEFPFLCGASSRALQQSRINLEKAYQNFFKKRAGVPKFKAKKKSAESYREPNVKNCIEIKGEKIKLLKLGWIKLSHLPKNFMGRIKSVTVCRTKTNEYYVSILTEQELVFKERIGDEMIGLDLGLTSFCINSRGEFIEPVDLVIRKFERKVRFWQKKLSRQVIDSQRREKTKLKLNKVYEKMKRLQAFFQWHLVNKLCSENRAISLESLQIKNLKKNRKLSHSIHIASWGEFLSKLKQKAVEYGTILYFADVYFASSKICSNCGNKKENLSLDERIYNCESCEHTEQRDINSAINLRNLIPNSSEYGENRHGEVVRPKSLRFSFRGNFEEVFTKNNVRNWA